MADHNERELKLEIPSWSKTLGEIIGEVKEFFGAGDSSSPPTTAQQLLRLLHSHSFNEMKEGLLKFEDSVNSYNRQGDALLHSLVKKQFAKSKRYLKRDLLTALLTYSDAKVNLRNKDNNRALHLAVQAGDIQTVETLLVFGAHINAFDGSGKTPLDLVEGPSGFHARQNHLDLEVSPRSPKTYQYRPLGVQPQAFGGVIESLCHSAVTTFTSVSAKSKEAQIMIDTLKKYGAERGEKIKERREFEDDEMDQQQLHPRRVRRVSLFQDMTMMELKDNTATPIKVRKSGPPDDWASKIAKYNYEISSFIERKMLNINHHFDQHPEETLAVMYQMRELKLLRDAGSRILFLDGGGMKGLVQIEILSQLEKETGRRITELFDWIVGTSTGGIIALALVHGKKTLRELRQFYLKLKDGIFGNSKAQFAFDTNELEKFLQDAFGDSTMDCVKYPRVLVAAVNKETVNLKIHFFNNCFDNELSTQPVWKVARYTSGGPLYFSGLDDYVDGGILANNPSASGLTEIQDFYRSKGQKLPISLIVSVGGGKPPCSKEMGNVDVHEYLYFGKHWFDFGEHIVKRLGNLTTLLGCAMGESETISENVASRCKEQGIDYYRFSPQLDSVVSVGETDLDALFNMVLTAKKSLRDMRSADAQSKDTKVPDWDCLSKGTHAKVKDTPAMNFRRLVIKFQQCSIANEKMKKRMKLSPRKT